MGSIRDLQDLRRKHNLRANVADCEADTAKIEGDDTQNAPGSPETNATDSNGPERPGPLRWL